MKQPKTKKVGEIFIKDLAVGEETALKRVRALFEKVSVPAVIRVDKNYEIIEGLSAIFEVGEMVTIKDRTFEVAAVVDGGILLKPVDLTISGSGENDS